MNEKQMSLLRICKAAMRKSIIRSLSGDGVYNTKESLLSYFDHAKFFGKDVESGYSNTTQAINRLCKIEHTGLIKLHKSAGSWSQYTFSKEIVERMIDDVQGR